MNVVRCLIVSGLLLAGIGGGLAGLGHRTAVSPHPSSGQVIADGPYPPVPVFTSTGPN